MSNKDYVKTRIVAVSGGFDPIHEGHIKLIDDARKHAGESGKVVAILNSDQWLVNKKGVAFMNVATRLAVLESLANIHDVIVMKGDLPHAIEGLTELVEKYPPSRFELAFANGGDRSSSAGNIPESDFCKYNNIEIIDGVGGDYKANSSSSILEDYAKYIVGKFVHNGKITEDGKYPQTTRVWGKFISLFSDENCHVKKLILDVGKSISVQYHHHRSEIWVVTKGAGTVTIDMEKRLITQGQSVFVNAGQIHQLSNTGKIPLEVIEVQKGDYFGEDDIVRLGDI